MVVSNADRQDGDVDVHPRHREIEIAGIRITTLARRWC